MKMLKMTMVSIALASTLTLSGCGYNTLQAKDESVIGAWSEVQNKEVVACETAILFEAGMVSYFDSILMVSAPLEIRIERCIKRNNFTREQVLERIAKQMDESKKIELSDFVIDNDNRKALYPQLKNFLNNLKA
mgnify:CR=1 FL=1